MMKIKNVIIAFIILIFSATTIAAQESAIDLTPKFVEGKSYSYRGNVDFSYVQKMPGPHACDVIFDGALNANLEYGINKVYEDESSEITITISDPKVKFAASCEGQENLMNFNFDSTQKPENEMKEIQVAREALNCIDGVSFVVKVNPKGEVLDIQGVDVFAQDLQKKLSNSNLIPESSTQEICSMIETKALEPFVNLIFYFLPETPVAIGQSWEKDTTVDNLTFKHTWILESANANNIVINETATIDIDQSLRVLESFMGTESGTITLDSQDNWINKIVSKATLQGKQSLNIPMTDGPLEMEITIKTNSVLERL